MRINIGHYIEKLDFFHEYKIENYEYKTVLVALVKD